MDCTINSTSAQQSAVGGIDDSAVLEGELCDVIADETDARVEGSGRSVERRCCYGAEAAGCVEKGEGRDLSLWYERHRSCRELCEASEVKTEHK